MVTNNGPSQARGVSVVDTLNTDLTFVNGSFDPGTSGVTVSQNGQTLTFDVGILDAAQTATFSFDVSIASSASGTISNTATASTTDNDSDNTNDADSVDLTVQRQVDLILTKAVNPATAVPGQDQLVYTFTVSHDTDSCQRCGECGRHRRPSGRSGRCRDFGSHGRQHQLCQQHRHRSNSIRFRSARREPLPSRWTSTKRRPER